MYKIVNDIQNVNNAKKESMSYEVYRSCEGEDHILVSDILRDDRRARGFHLGIRYKPNTPNIRTDSLKLLRKLKKNFIICLEPTTN